MGNWQFWVLLEQDKERKIELPPRIMGFWGEGMSILGGFTVSYHHHHNDDYIYDYDYFPLQNCSIVHTSRG